MADSNDLAVDARLADDSGVEDNDADSETTSVHSSIYRYRFENGRRYHAYRDGEYWGPNDEKANDHLDIAHNLWLKTQDGKLALAPLPEKVGKVLDVGCGTGIWAMYATLPPLDSLAGRHEEGTSRLIFSSSFASTATSRTRTRKPKS